MSNSNSKTFLSEQYLLQLFNLEPNNVDEISLVNTKDGLIAYIKLVRKLHECPVCGFRTDTIKGYTKKNILHSLVTN